MTSGTARGFAFFACLCLGVVLAFPAGVCAQSSNYELERRIEQLEKRLGQYEQEDKGVVPGAWAEKITLSGAVELDFSYADDSDVTDDTAGEDSTSDLDIGTVELGLEIAFHEAVTGTVLLKGENIDDDDSDVFFDEAFITIQKEGVPFYFVGGKRAQPFGLFNSHLINDPLTQDCYEIVKSGATVGVTPSVADVNMDISLTVYRGETLMDKVSDPDELGFRAERDFSASYDEETDDVSSYIANLTASLLEESLLLAAYYDSEPGDTDRNDTAGASIAYVLESVGLSFDAEYIAALNREKHVEDDKEYKESAWFVAAAYRIMDPLEIAVRYEGFDDDQEGDQAGHLEDRYSLGFTYTLFEKDNFVCNLMGEYRTGNYEEPAGADGDLNEFFARVAIEF